ncbi:hypothetical protein HPB48_026567 [Haemaphysalis longicornis]|uniref:Uncharacterized protein n=1 Tax=Haemaphysalis longicornis TaxID=44386 RepID=A0A9J6H1G3_HAELO|nr:hypothetical protein HPB48_026567 [Haemaphysalis longicornis]
MWEARHGLVKRWKKQKHSKRLKLRIARISKEAQNYAEALTRTNWHNLCEKYNGNLSAKRTWSLLRSLIQPNQSTTDKAKDRTRLLHRQNKDPGQTLEELSSIYLQR